MALWIRKIDAITPATLVTDVLAAAPQLHNDIPCFIGFQYWVTTPGGASAGAYSVSLAYVDPTGTERLIPGFAISLQDDEAIHASPVQIIERQSDVSLFEIREELFGAADGAEVSYRVILTNPAGEEAYMFNS
jgi:hypothetical protein